MKWNYDKIITTQAKVNEKVNQKLKNPPSAIDYVLAMHVEVFEFINACGFWKWWKHSHTPNKEKILDELADVMAFFFSYVLTLPEETQASLPGAMEEIYEELVDYQAKTLLEYITISIHEGREQNAVTLMIQCVIIAGQVIQATWKEIEDAFFIKSEINIQRQTDNY
jgi:dimeric dUTPase (all-alpha-NTP-PPase superfamily)